MKKILSFVLVLAMIASMMCINVAAEAEDVVGTHGVKNTVEDGISYESFGTGKSSSEMTIQANINGTQVTRYAVELVYTSKSIWIESNLEWDVNKLHYEGDAYIHMNAAENAKKPNFDAANVSNDWTPLENDQTVHSLGEFAVTNYSCAAITVTADVDASALTTADGVIGITTDVHVTALQHGTKTVNKAQTGASILNDATHTVSAVDGYDHDTTGTTYTGYYEADMVCEDWAMALYGAPSTLVIAKVTFTFAPVAAQGTN